MNSWYETDNYEGLEDKSRVKRRRTSRSATLSVEQWLEAVFLNRVPILSYDHQSTILIDNPSETLRREIIGFKIDDAVAEIKEVAARGPHARYEPVITLSRGIGGGKTRALVEICKGLIEQDEGIITAVITFNTTTAINLDRWIHLDNESIRDGDKYALSIIARLGYCFFGGPAWKYVQIVDRIMNFLPTLETHPSSDTSQLISAMIRLIVTRVCSSKNVNSIVILVDEVLEADKQLKLRDSSSILRQAVLKDEIITGLKTAIVMSTLCSEAYSATLRGSGLRMLRLPDRLNIDKVLSQWWDTAVDCTRDQTVLKLVAASMNSLPRVLEFASKYLRDNRVMRRGDHGKSSEEAVIDSAFVSGLYKYVLREMRDRYPPSLPSNEILRAIYFGQHMKLGDTGVIHAINLSVITNSLGSLHPDSEFVPETSLIRLKALFQSGDEQSRRPLFVRELLRSVDAVLEAIPLVITAQRNISKLLDVILLECVSARVVLASSTNMMSLADILGITAHLEEDSPGQKLLPSSLSSLIEWRGVVLPERVQLSCTSSADFECWLTLLHQVEVNDISPIALVLPYEGNCSSTEPWDLCIKVNPSAINGHMPLYVFLCTTTFGIRATDEFAKNLRIADQSESDFILMNVTTNDVPTTPIGSRCPPDDNVHSLVVGRDGTRALMGPYFEIYSAACELTLSYRD
jgi:hypothetical protein